MVDYTKDILGGEAATNGWTIGDFTYGHPAIHSWGRDGNLSIGKYCSIAGGVQILLGGNHRPDWVTTYPFNALRAKAAHIQGHPATKGDVVIGNDVWLGMHCTIMSGVTIGDGAVVAAFSVVAKDVEPYAIVGGNPAKMLRKRFPDAQIAGLLKAAWWNWPPDLIESNYDMLQSQDIDRVVEMGRLQCGRDL